MDRMSGTATPGAPLVVPLAASNPTGVDADGVHLGHAQQRPGRYLCHHRRDRPARLSTRLTVLLDTPMAAAMRAWRPSFWRWRFSVPMGRQPSNRTRGGRIAPAPPRFRPVLPGYWAPVVVLETGASSMVTEVMVMSCVVL